jgi:hypothetical protein
MRGSITGAWRCSRTRCSDDVVIEGTDGDRSRCCRPMPPARFLGLPAELTYAVVARAEGPSGRDRASCADGSRVIADDETRLVVTMVDQLTPRHLSHGTRIEPDLCGGARRGGAHRGRGGARRLGWRYGLPARRDRPALRERGEDADAEALRMPAIDGLETRVASQLEMTTSGPSLAVEDLTAMFEARLGKVVIASESCSRASRAIRIDLDHTPGCPQKHRIPTSSRSRWTCRGSG